MKKRIALVLIALASIIVLQLILISNLEPSIQLSPLENPFSISSIPDHSLPPDCSDASIKSVWDTYFKETSSGATIITNTSLPNICTSYYAHKTQENTTYILIGYYNYFNVSGHVRNDTLTLAIKSNLTSTGKIYIQNISQIDSEGLIPFFTFFSLIVDNSTTSVTNINSEIEAFSQYDSTFKITNSSNFHLNNSYPDQYYGYSENENIQNLTKTINGIVFSKKDLTFFVLQKVYEENYTSQNPIQPCTPQWAPIDTSCTSSETLTTNYIKLNPFCHNETGKPVNTTTPCDYDNNGIIGSLSRMQLTNINLTVFISNFSINLSNKYNSTKIVELKENNLTIVSFQYDFSKPLNLDTIIITKQPSSSSLGYIIINGLETEKTVLLDKLNSNSSGVCVKDSSINAISSMSNNCTASDEYSVSCPGSTHNYDCEISENKFIISGLEHSAIRETGILNSSNSTSCIQNWNCTAWSTCLQSSHTRTCTDLKNCNNLTGKLPEIETCESPVVCTPNWNCTAWSPSTCPKIGNLTKTCTDLNNCNINTGKPSTQQSCVYKSRSNMIIILIIICVLVMLALGLLVYYILTNSSNKPNIIQQPQTSDWSV